MSRQFEVHSNIFSADRAGPPNLINLQADHLSALRTIVVAPLWPASGPRPPAPVSVAVTFDRQQYWLAINEITFVRLSSVGPVMGNITVARDRIVRALDLLFTGV